MIMTKASEYLLEALMVGIGWAALGLIGRWIWERKGGS